MKLGVSEIISIAVFAISVISSLISIFVSKFKNKTKLEECKSAVERNKQIISLISEIIPKAVEFAEKNGNSPANKKLLALSQTLIDSMANGIDYTSLSQMIDETIEALVKFTKHVNVTNVQVKGEV